MKKSRINVETISVIHRRSNSGAGIPKDEDVHKTCRKCGNEYPLTTAYWRRKKDYADGFDTTCKTCAADAIKDHYRKWEQRDVDERGSTGVKCLLWSEYCGQCNIKDLIAECWRINEEDFIPETHPVQLRDNEL